MPRDYWFLRTGRAGLAGFAWASCRWGDRDLLLPRPPNSGLARLAREAEQRSRGLQGLRLETTFRAPGDRVTHRENLQLIGTDARGLVLGRIEAIEALRCRVHGGHPQIEDHARFGLGDADRHFATSRRETQR